MMMLVGDIPRTREVDGWKNRRPTNKTRTR